MVAAAFREGSAKTCVGVELRITVEGFAITEEHRDPQALERGQASMRNLRGELIK
jgi:hypothetical protein